MLHYHRKAGVSRTSGSEPNIEPLLLEMHHVVWIVEHQNMDPRYEFSNDVADDR